MANGGFAVANPGQPILQALEQVAQRRRQERLREENRALQQQQQEQSVQRNLEMQLLNQYIEQGVPLGSNAAVQFPNLPSNIVDSFAKIQKEQLKAKKAEEGIQSELTTVRNIGALPGAGLREGETAQPGRAGPVAEAIRQAQAEIDQQSPEVQDRLRSQLETVLAEARAAREVSVESQRLELNKERRREVVEANKEFINSAAVRISGIQLTERDPRRVNAQIDEVFRDIEQRFGPNSSDILHEVMNKAEAQIVSERVRVETPEGRDQFGRTVDAIMEAWGIDKADATLLASGKGFRDPVLLKVIPSGGAEWNKGRYALAQLINTMSAVQSAAVEMAQEVAAGEAFGGPVLGAEPFRNFARFVGIDTPGVAAYETNVRTFVSLLLKSIQGSRPSDFDLRFYMGMMPLLTEITFDENGNLHPAVQRRFEAMDEMLKRAATTPIDSRMAQEANRLRLKTETREDAALRVAAEKFATGETSLSQFNEALGAWKGSRGATFRSEKMEKRATGRGSEAVEAWRNSRGGR